MNNVNLRRTPNGSVERRLPLDEVIYISGQQYDLSGIVWHYVTVMATGENGYLREDVARFMTQREIQAYLNRPTARPTVVPTQQPTQRPTMAPDPMKGYARVVWQSTYLRSAPASGTVGIKVLSAGNVVYAMSSFWDSTNTRWLYVSSDGVSGYVLAGAVVMMTQPEIDAYLESISRPVTPRPTIPPTPVPTIAPTLNPMMSYAVVKKDNVNVRREPNGALIMRVNKGTLATLLSGAIPKDGYNWYSVQIGDEIGYLREDVIDFVQIKPTAPPTPVPTPVPTPTPTPTPSPTPTPTPLPTAGPLSLLDRVRATMDGVRYEAFARALPDAAAYAARDFDCDKAVELLTISVAVAADGTRSLTLDVYKFTDGVIRRVDSRTFAPVLTPGTEMQVVLVMQDGREIVYTARRNTVTMATIMGQGMTLTASGWLDAPLSGNVQNLTPLLLAAADANGVLSLDDRTGLGEPRGEETAVDREATSVVLRLLMKLMETATQGNG